MTAVVVGMVSGTAVAQDQRAGVDRRGGITSGIVGAGAYSRPVWRKMGKGTFVGGYFDVDFQKAQGQNGRFRQQRLIPFLYGDIAEGLRFATEIEFENGGVSDEVNLDNVEVDTTTGKGTAEGDLSGEVKIEFAFLDYAVGGEPFGIRAGLLLTPLGKLNAVHDSPLQDLTDRPLVNRVIIPTTLSEPGAGVFGTVYPSELSKLDYEVYVVNGFNGGDGGSNISAKKGLRAARGSASSDNNGRPAWVGRVGVSPWLGGEVGASVHTGAYDNAGSRTLTIGAVDWGFQHGPWELLGEAAKAWVEKGAETAAGVPPQLTGYYVQGNYHFLQDVARPGSTFTGVARYDAVNTDRSTPGKGTQRLTLGLNFRPVEDTVFKLDYQLNFEDGARTRVPNDAVLASVATYF